MNEEMMLNMIANCARMEAALKLLRSMMEKEINEKYSIIHPEELNTVLIVAGMEPVKKEESQTVEE